MPEKKQIKISQVGEVDPNKKNSTILDGPFPEETGADTTKALCWFNGAQYAPGAEICSGSIRLRCHANGNWYRHGRC